MSIGFKGTRAEAREATRIYMKEGEGRTIQSHTKECDVNQIMKKYARTGTISHLAKHQASYGEVAATDLHEAMNLIKRAEDMFGELPNEIRKEFENNPQKFFAYVNDPANIDDLAEKLPALAEPGYQLPQLGAKGMIQAAAQAAAEAVKATETPKTDKPMAESQDGDKS